MSTALATAARPAHVAPRPFGDGGHVSVDSEVEPGNDVAGVPHGGYLAALAARAVLEASGRPDLFTITVHYLRRAAVAPIRFEVDVVGASRRFTTVTARATQDGAAVLGVMASVGDRTGIAGPDWRRRAPWSSPEADLLPPADCDGLPFEPPAIARRFRLRPDHASFAFARGERTGDATQRALVPVQDPDVFTALIAADITPPAIWNALGAAGWVPTIELTAHVRAHPAPGALTVVATTDHVTDGFIEESAEVHDSTGRLIVQSRQLARWTGT